MLYSDKFSQAFDKFSKINAQDAFVNSMKKGITEASMSWPYFTLNKDGKLVDEDGTIQFKDKTFKDEAEAEQYLMDNDIRGNVKPSNESVDEKKEKVNKLPGEPITGLKEPTDKELDQMDRPAPEESEYAKLESKIAVEKLVVCDKCYKTSRTNESKCRHCGSVKITEVIATAEPATFDPAITVIQNELFKLIISGEAISSQIDDIDKMSEDIFYHIKNANPEALEDLSQLKGNKELILNSLKFVLGQKTEEEFESKKIKEYSSAEEDHLAGKKPIIWRRWKCDDCKRTVKIDCNRKEHTCKKCGKPMQKMDESKKIKESSRFPKGKEVTVKPGKYELVEFNPDDNMWVYQDEYVTLDKSTKGIVEVDIEHPPEVDVKLPDGKIICVGHTEISESRRIVKEDYEYKSDEDIEKEFSGMEIRNIEITGRNDDSGKIEISFPNAEDSVGGGTNEVVDYWIKYKHGRVAFENWYPEKTYNILVAAINKEIAKAKNESKLKESTLEVGKTYTDDDLEKLGWDEKEGGLYNHKEGFLLINFARKEAYIVRDVGSGDSRVMKVEKKLDKIPDRFTSSSEVEIEESAKEIRRPFAEARSEEDKKSFDKERKEHPTLSDDLIWQIVDDHKSIKVDETKLKENDGGSNQLNQTANEMFRKDFEECDYDQQKAVREQIRLKKFNGRKFTKNDIYTKESTSKEDLVKNYIADHPNVELHEIVDGLNGSIAPKELIDTLDKLRDDGIVAFVQEKYVIRESNDIDDSIYNKAIDIIRECLKSWYDNTDDIIVDLSEHKAIKRTLLDEVGQDLIDYVVEHRKEILNNLDELCDAVFNTHILDEFCKSKRYEIMIKSDAAEKYGESIFESIDYTVIAKGITTKEDADKLAKEKSGTVSPDDEDKTKFMVIVKNK